MCDSACLYSSTPLTGEDHVEISVRMTVKMAMTEKSDESCIEDTAPQADSPPGTRLSEWFKVSGLCIYSLLQLSWLCIY